MTAHIDRRQLLLGTAALGGSALLAHGATWAQATTAIKYLTPFGFLMGFAETMYADTGGFFKKHGLDVTIEGGKGSAMAVQQVTAGNVLLSRTGGTDLIKAYARDNNLVAIADVFPKDLFFVISHKDKPIAKPEAMAGKTIGVVSVGGATENILDMMLAKVGVKKEDVKRETAGNAPTAFELVKAGRLSGYIATNDTVFQLKADNQPITAWSCDDVAPSPGQVYMTSKRAMEANGDAVTRFLRAVHDAIGAIVDSKDLPHVIASMTAKYDVVEAKRPDKGVSVLENAIVNYRAVQASKLKINPATFESAHELMVKAGIIQPLPDKAYYSMAAWQKAFG
jgi:ABC-type nitrate/sulfonate/bicarbonate transport system substrate-binding protein